MRRLFWLVALAVVGCSPPPPPEAEIRALHEQLDRLERTVDQLGATYDAAAHVYRTEVLPIERALARRARSPEMARRVAWVIRNEAKRAGLSPSLIAGVEKLARGFQVFTHVSYLDQFIGLAKQYSIKSRPGKNARSFPDSWFKVEGA